MSEHQGPIAANVAFKLGRYVDKAGQEWNKGLDGWFFDDGDAVWLVYHQDMAAMIAEEQGVTA